MKLAALMLLIAAPLASNAQPAPDPLIADLLARDRAAAVKDVAARAAEIEQALERLKTRFDDSIHSARDAPEQRRVRYDKQALEHGLALGRLLQDATGNDRPARAFAARQLRIEGTELLNEREYRHALVKLNAALAEAQALDDVWLQLITRINIAYGYLELDDIASALAACEDARGLADRSAPRARALAIFNLASVQMHARNFEAAIPLADEAATLARQIGNRLWEGNARLNLGVAHLELEHLDEAGRELTAARDVLLKTQDKLGIGRAHYNLALVSQARGDLRQAAVDMEGALPLIRTVDIRHSHAIEQERSQYYNPFEEAALQLLAEWHAQLGNRVQAQSYAEALAAVQAKRPEATGHRHKPGA